MLAALTWPKATRLNESVLVVPLGSTDSDTDIATALGAQVAGRPDAMVAPAVPYSASGEHAGFGGTLSIGQAALELLVVELVRSAGASFGRVLLLSGHGGNAGPLARAAMLLRAEGHDVRVWSPPWRGDAHAGRTETSVQLALGARALAEQARAGATGALAELLPAFYASGVLRISPNGVLGDPAGADTDEGHDLLASAAADLHALLDSW